LPEHVRRSRNHERFTEIILDRFMQRFSSKLKLPRRGVLALVGALLLAVLLVTGWLLIQHQSRRMYLRNGRKALARSAVEDALFFSAKAVKADPQGVEACRLMADALAAAKAPDTVFWRVRVARIEPGKVENYLRWAQAAFDVGRSDWAAEALTNAPKEAENRADWQNLMGRAQTNLVQVGEAEQHFERAVQLEPTNAFYSVNLATLQLSSPDSAIAGAARQELNRLSVGEAAGRLALEVLLRDALRSRDFESARIYSKNLEERPDQNWEDRLLELDAASQTTAFKIRLTSLQQECSNNLGNRVSLVYWMIGHGLPKDATDWIDAGTGAKPLPIPLQMAAADAFSAQQNWTRIREMLEPTDWAANDFIRKSLLARCEREKSDSSFKDRWQEALRSVQGDQEKKFRLGQLVSSWGWYSEASELFWDVVDTYPMWRSNALSELWRNSVFEKNTAGMLRVAAERYHDRPKDPGARNNYAFLLLLLDIDERRAQELAKEAWNDAPLQPDIAATYAFALYKAGRTEDGIKALEQLADRYRDDPGIALYYAALLAEAGNSVKASRYLALSDNSPRLLPEEQALVTKIKLQIEQH
jgi:tetratricopeptide (TPR) repeat protein